MAFIRKDRIWPVAITLVLAGNVVLGIVLFRVARDDPHFAVEPNYYQKAVAWDSTMAESQRSAVLGWSVVPAVGEVRAGVPSSLRLVVRDGAGVPVVGAVVDVDALPIAYASEGVHVALVAGSAAGEYVASLPVTHAGLWELRVRIAQGVDVFRTVIRMELSPHGMATLVTARPGDPVP